MTSYWTRNSQIVLRCWDVGVFCALTDDRMSDWFQVILDQVEDGVSVRDWAGLLPYGRYPLMRRDGTRIMIAPNPDIGGVVRETMVCLGEGIRQRHSGSRRSRRWTRRRYNQRHLAGERTVYIGRSLVTVSGPYTPITERP